MGYAEANEPSFRGVVAGYLLLVVRQIVEHHPKYEAGIRKATAIAEASLKDEKHRFGSIGAIEMHSLSFPRSRAPSGPKSAPWRQASGRKAASARRGEGWREVDSGAAVTKKNALCCRGDHRYCMSCAAETGSVDRHCCAPGNLATISRADYAEAGSRRNTTRCPGPKGWLPAGTRAPPH